MTTTLSTPSTPIRCSVTRKFLSQVHAPFMCLNTAVGYQKSQGLEIRCTRSHQVGQFHTKKKIMNPRGHQKSFGRFVTALEKLIQTCKFCPSLFKTRYIVFLEIYILIITQPKPSL